MISLSDLINEVAKRDLNKEKMSPASVLGIKLGKFSGYESLIDIYIVFRTNLRSCM